MFDMNMMRISIELAQQALHTGYVPVGAVIARNGQIIAKAHNGMIHGNNHLSCGNIANERFNGNNHLSSKKTEHELFNRATFLPSPMRHAEILALIEGAHNIRNDDSNSARSHSIEKSCIHDNCLSNNQCKCSRDNRFGDNCPGNYAFEGDRLDDCDMYVTLEPCQMCIGAITLMRLKRVIFGAYSALWLNECARPSPAPRRIIHGESAPAIATHPHSHDNQTSAVEDRGHAYSPGECAPNHHVELIGGILESECADLMHEYFKSRRGFTITNINKAV